MDKLRLTRKELAWLLSQVDLCNLDKIEPLNDEEVAELETAYIPPTNSLDRAITHQQFLDELIQEFKDLNDPSS